MTRPENTSPEEENKNHTYVTNRIPWFVHADLDHVLDPGDRVRPDVSVSRDSHGVPQPAVTMTQRCARLCALLRAAGAALVVGRRRRGGAVLLLLRLPIRRQRRRLRDGDRPESRWMFTRLGLAIFCTMNVMAFTMALWSGDVYGGEDSAPVRSLQGIFRYLAMFFAVPVFYSLGLPLLENAWDSLQARHRQHRRAARRRAWRRRSRSRFTRCFATTGPSTSKSAAWCWSWSRWAAGWKRRARRAHRVRSTRSKNCCPKRCVLVMDDAGVGEAAAAMS